MYLRGNKHELWWHRKRLHYIISFLSEILEKDRAVTFADIGCAEGFYIEYVTSRYSRTYCIGVDIASAYVKKAKMNCKTSNTDFVVCDVANLPFKKDSVDVILCSEVLEHVYDYLKSVSEIARTGKKYLIISFPGHTCIYKIIGKMGPLKRFADRLVPDVGHVSEVKLGQVQATLKGNYVACKIRIGSAFPIRGYQFVFSTRLVDFIDDVICSILQRTGLDDYANIHVMKVTKSV